MPPCFYFFYTMDSKNLYRNAKTMVAIGCFLVASALAFMSVMIHEEHDIASGVIMVIAQFLLLCATIFGVHYRPTVPPKG